MFLSYADYFQKQLFQKIISQIPLICQTVLDPDQAGQIVWPDLDPYCLHKLSGATRR